MTAIAIAALVLAPQRNDETSFIRQFAKDSPPVYIIANNPEALNTAAELRRTIMAHKDLNPKKRIEILTEVEASALALRDEKMKDAVMVFMHLGQPSSVYNRMQDSWTIAPGEMTGTVSKIKTVRTRDANQGLAFRVSMYAPDSPRLEKLLGEFSRRTFSDWRRMEIDSTFRTYKIVKYGNQAESDLLRNWGKTNDEWFFEESRPLIDFGREDRAEFDQAVVVETSARQNLPSPIDQLLRNQNFGPLDVGAYRTRGSNGQWTAVLAAPTSRHLAALCNRFRTVPEIPSEGYRFALADLRTLGRSVVLLISNGPDTNLDQDRSVFESEIANATTRPVLPLSGSAIAIQDLIRGQSSSTSDLIKREKIQFIWAIEPSQVSKRTSYSTRQTRTTPEPPAPSIPPLRPRRSDYPKGIEGDIQYRQALQTYLIAQEVYDFRMSERQRMRVDWLQTTDRIQEASASVSLKLYELGKGEAKLLWQATYSGGERDTSFYDSRTVTVIGFATTPSLGYGPPPTSDCEPRLVRGAIQEAFRRDVDELHATALLTGPPPTKTDTDWPEPEPPKPPKPVPPTLTKKITSVRGKTYTINAGRSVGVSRGDKFLIPIRWVQKDGLWKTAEHVTLVVKDVFSSTCTAQLVSNSRSNRARAKVGVGVLWFGT